MISLDFNEMICVRLALIDFAWLGLAWITIKFEWFVHDSIEMFFVLTLTMSHRPSLSLSLAPILCGLPFHCCDSSQAKAFYESFISTNDILFNVITFVARKIKIEQQKKRRRSNNNNATIMKTTARARAFFTLKIPPHSAINVIQQSCNLNNVLVFIRKLIFIGNGLVLVFCSFWRSFT